MFSISLLRNPTVRFFIPLITLSAIGFSYDFLALKAAQQASLALSLPYYFLATAILLSQLFSQPRVGMIAVIMTIAYTVIQERLQTPLYTGSTRLEYVLLALLLPFNLLYMLIFPNRRLLSRWGGYFFLAVVLQFGWAALMVQEYGANSPSMLSDGYLKSIEALGPMPVLLTLNLLICTCIAALSLLKRNASEDQAAFVCLLCATVTLAFFNHTHISSICFSAAGLLLIINLISFSHQLAFVDGLTGIPGRRALEDELKHVGRRYSIAMVDVDHFKKFNDTHGHDTGDDVLRLVASLLSKCEGGAKAFRYGGEEFTLLFKGKGSDQCLSFLEDVRESIEHYPLILRDSEQRPENDKAGRSLRGNNKAAKPIHITVSIGLADFVQGNSPGEVISEADKALYKAKKAGRNCIKS